MSNTSIFIFYYIGEKDMIKEFKINNLDEVMKIWIETNIEAHNFVPKEYWINNFQGVKEMLPLAEVYI